MRSCERRLIALMEEALAHARQERARPVFYVTRERKAQLVESGEWGRFVKESRPVTIDMSSGIPIAR